MDKFGLGLRVKPYQQRAKNTMDLVLDTAITIMDEVGPDALSTKLIAERAGILIRNVYRYFKNKQAIFYALALRMAEKQTELLNDFEFIKDRNIDLAKAFEKTLDSFFYAAIEVPGMLSMRKAMLSSPELQAFENQLNQGFAKALAKALRTRGVSIPNRKLDRICIIILYIATALMDHAGMEIIELNNRSAARQIIDELKQVIRGYLSLHNIGLNT
jgi:AcrR family transcriptional regulator